MNNNNHCLTTPKYNKANSTIKTKNKNQQPTRKQRYTKNSILSANVPTRHQLFSPIFQCFHNQSRCLTVSDGIVRRSTCKSTWHQKPFVFVFVGIKIMLTTTKATNKRGLILINNSGESNDSDVPENGSRAVCPSKAAADIQWIFGLHLTRKSSKSRKGRQRLQCESLNY